MVITLMVGVSLFFHFGGSQCHILGCAANGHYHECGYESKSQGKQYSSAQTHNLHPLYPYIILIIVVFKQGKNVSSHIIDILHRIE